MSAIEDRPDLPDDAAVVTMVQQWRRRVVRSWLAVMVAALALVVATAIWPLPGWGEVLAGTALAVLTWNGFRSARAGRCPRCSTRIRFQPRIELPPACTACGVAFSAQKEPDA
jgi:hypothetical protein